MHEFDFVFNNETINVTYFLRNDMLVIPCHHPIFAEAFNNQDTARSASLIVLCDDGKCQKGPNGSKIIDSDKKLGHKVFFTAMQDAFKMTQ